MPIIKNFTLALLLLFFFPEGFCQDQRIADSLKNFYNAGAPADNDMELLRGIAENELKPDSTLKYSKLLVERALAESSLKMAHNGYLQMGNAFIEKGTYDQALKAFFKSREYATLMDYEEGVGKSSIRIADTYSESGNSANAAIYYDRGIEILRKKEGTLSLGIALLNAGDENIRIDSLEKAMHYLDEAERIFMAKNSVIGLAYCHGNRGIIQVRRGGDLEAAEENLNRAISPLMKLGDFSPVITYLGYLADLHLAEGDVKGALDSALQALSLAKRYGLKERAADANLKLSNIYGKVGDTGKSFTYYKNYIAYRDSVKNIQVVRDMANMRTDYEISRKQAEVDLLNEQRKNQKTTVIATVIALFLILLLTLGLYRRNRFIGRTKKMIEKEKQRSDLLLLNILPQETAVELKEKGKVQAKRFDSVTVLFTDFRNFTHYAENLSPEELVESVDFYFSEFDRIVERYALEKIKTVGDSYMCAAGVPFPVEDHAVKIVSAACEMVAFVKSAKTLISEKETRFDIRIGINSGPVVAGVVGSKKFAYDIWGDAVNIASRMETCSDTGRINISENTYKLVRPHFKCEYRGEIEVKNKGMMKMYFVNCITDD